jgi:hypothetical protein
MSAEDAAAIPTSLLGTMVETGESGASRIGTPGTQTNADVAGISGVTVPTGIAVIVWQTANFVNVSKSHKRSDEKVTTSQPFMIRGETTVGKITDSREYEGLF